MRVLLYVCLCVWSGWVSGSEVLRVVSLNPIASDLARQVGGDAVEVVALMKAGQDPHAYAPSPGDLREAEGATLILAMGKGLETYLDDLRQSLRPEQAIFEIGRMIPSLRIEADMELFACCPVHAHGAVDPHWWHSVRNMRRAARLVSDAFSKALPARKDDYQAQYKAYDARLVELESWAKEQIGRIPAKRRQLTTAHAAFNYFCQDYHFKAIPILGLSTLDQPTPGQMRQVFDALAEQGVRVIFPENGTNPAPLEAVAKEAGVRLGGTLLAGSPLPDDPTFEALFRHNITSIVEALAPEEGEL